MQAAYRLEIMNSPFTTGACLFPLLAHHDITWLKWAAVATTVELKGNNKHHVSNVSYIIITAEHPALILSLLMLMAR